MDIEHGFNFTTYTSVEYNNSVVLVVKLTIRNNQRIKELPDVCIREYS